MEKFTRAKPFTLHPGYLSDREKNTSGIRRESAQGFDSNNNCICFLTGDDDGITLRDKVSFYPFV